eukprot:4533138-Pyramimonas_sp.AAC.1
MARKRAKMVQCGLQDGQHAVEDCQDGPAWPPRRPKMPSRTAKIARKGLQMAPRGLQKPAGTPKRPPRGLLPLLLIISSASPLSSPSSPSILLLPHIPPPSVFPKSFSNGWGNTWSNTWASLRRNAWPHR